MGSRSIVPSDQGEPESLSLLVVIPCLNEEMTVEKVVRDVPSTIGRINSIDVLVVDDGSTDDTAARARRAGAAVLSHPTNEGLGATFRESVSFAVAQGVDIMVHIDGDGQFDPVDIALLVEPILRGKADMATASRFLDPEMMPEMPALKRWGNRGVARIVQLLSGRRFRDVSCGFRAFSREALLRLNLFGNFTYTQESFLDLVFKGLPIVEVPVKVRGTREFGDSRVASSLLGYGRRSLQIMLRAFIAYRPFVLFLVISGAFLVPGIALLVFLFSHYFRTGAFTPHIWAGFVGGSLGFVGLVALIMGFVSDVLVRIRLNQEEILYHHRLSIWKEGHTATSQRLSGRTSRHTPS